MNQVHLTHLLRHFNLGHTIKNVDRVYGGLLHRMWRVDTEKRSYAIKQLSTKIDLGNKLIVKNYEQSETVASKFIELGIPGVCALSESNKYLCILDTSGYLVYPWIEAHALVANDIQEEQAIIIAKLLSKMHQINLKIDGFYSQEPIIHDNEKIRALTTQSLEFQLPFSTLLSEILPTIIELNEQYAHSAENLNNNTIIGHGDLDPKNVLWIDNKHPVLIDWESVQKINPMYEIVNVSLDWSVHEVNINIENFQKMLIEYCNAGGIIDHSMAVLSLDCVMGNWINWLVFNVERSLSSLDFEQQTIGIDQVHQTLHRIKQLQKMMPRLNININQLYKCLTLLKEILVDDLLAVYLYGSAVVDGLQKYSDIDLFVVSKRGTNLLEKQKIVYELLKISGIYMKSKDRPIELTIVVQSDINPWQFPPKFDFQYGEWLRHEFENGNVEPWQNKEMPDLAILITQIYLASHTLFGKSPDKILPEVPYCDFVAAMTDGLDNHLLELNDDTRNVLLTLARIWFTLETGTISSKPKSALWVIEHLPDHLKPVLARAKAICIGESDEHWDDVKSNIIECAQYLIDKIRSSHDQIMRENNLNKKIIMSLY